MDGEASDCESDSIPRAAQKGLTKTPPMMVVVLPQQPSDLRFLAPQGAHEAYERAYKVSVMVSGAETRPTLDIKGLVDHQPKSVDELRARYNADKM